MTALTWKAVRPLALRRYWWAMDRLGRYRRAWKYATARIEGDDASRLLYDAEQAAGIQALESLSVDDVVQRLLEHCHAGAAGVGRPSDGARRLEVIILRRCRFGNDRLGVRSGG